MCLISLERVDICKITVLIFIFRVEPKASYQSLFSVNCALASCIVIVTENFLCLSFASVNVLLCLAESLEVFLHHVLCSTMYLLFHVHKPYIRDRHAVILCGNNARKNVFPSFKTSLFAEIQNLYFCILSFESGEFNLL